MGVARRHGSVPPPTATYRLQLRPGFGFTEVEARVPTWRRSASPTSTCRRCCRPHPARSTGTTSSTTTASPGARRRSGAPESEPDRPRTRPGPDRRRGPEPHGRTGARLAQPRAVVGACAMRPASPYATWFDIDWEVADHALLMPVLGEPIDVVLDRDQLSVAACMTVPRWCATTERTFPVRPGYRGVAPREAARGAVVPVGLVAGRGRGAELPPVLRCGQPRGAVRGVGRGVHRHPPPHARPARGGGDRRLEGGPPRRPDLSGGLPRSPGGCRTGDLGRGREDPAAGRASSPTGAKCDGTTGYDTLDVVSGLFIDPVGWTALASAHASRTGAEPEFATVAEQAKRDVLGAVLRTEVERLVDLAAQVCTDQLRLRDHSLARRSVMRSPSCSWPSTAAASTCVPTTSPPDAALHRATFLGAAAVAREPTAPRPTARAPSTWWQTWPLPGGAGAPSSTSSAPASSRLPPQPWRRGSRTPRSTAGCRWPARTSSGADRGPRVFSRRRPRLRGPAAT